MRKLLALITIPALALSPLLIGCEPGHEEQPYTPQQFEQPQQPQQPQQPIGVPDQEPAVPGRPEAQGEQQELPPGW